MRSGLLTGTSAAERWAALPEDDWRRGHPDFQEPALSRNLLVVERLRAIADELDASLGELAVAWTLQWPGVTGAIVGARRPVQVEDWVGAASLELDDEVLDRIGDVLQESGAGSGPVRPPVARVG
jgi:aryl-alcohol dehydrogenase-like predicted oxidoreductase